MEERVNLPLWDPNLAERLFIRYGGEPGPELTRGIDRSGVQDSSVARICRFVRELVGRLVDDDGNLLAVAVEEAIKDLRAHLYPLGPGRHREGLFRIHILRCLMRLREPAVQRIVKQTSCPVDNRAGENLIRSTLDLEDKTKVTAALARRALLASWMTPLRQSVGSCFATAPAIMIQSSQPQRFLSDLSDLLTVGHLTRIVEGRDLSVPLGKGWGLGELRRPILKGWVPDPLCHSPALSRALGGNREEVRALLARVALPEGPTVDCDFFLRALLPAESLEPARDRFKRLADCALLKAWEFSLASFVDLRADLNRWNLYNALGIRHDEMGGIGTVVHGAIELRLAEVNRELELLDESFDRAESGFDVSKGRLKTAKSQEEAQWMQADLGRRKSEAEHIGEERYFVERRGQCLTRLFVALMNRYLELMAESFQEAYDADMQDVETGPFDDSPAGFRLVYKHGRRNPSAWTPIDSKEEFVDALVDFFVITEPQLLPEEQWQPIRGDLSFIVSQIVTHLRAPGFVEAAMQRMGELYGSSDPIKPWAYQSGGSMSNLLRHYYGTSKEAEKRGRWVDSPFDLCVMLLDIFKELPPRVMQPLVDDPTRALLMESPTHAFVAKPGLPPFSAGWQDPGNSYTWTRDRIVLPGRDFLRSIRLSPEEKRWMVDRLLGGQTVEIAGSSVSAFRAALFDRVGEAIDPFLFSSLPLCPHKEALSRIEKIFSYLLKGEKRERFADFIRRNRPPQIASGYLTALELQHLAHALWMAYTQSATSGQDLPFVVR